MAFGAKFEDLKLKSRSGNHTAGHLNNSEGKWHAGTVSNMQRNCQGEFIFAWHCDTLCLLACNLSFCTLRRQKTSPLHLLPPPLPFPEPNPFHLFNGGGLGVRACSASVANQPSRAVSSDGERSLSLAGARWTGGALTPAGVGGVDEHAEGRKRREGGVNELATHLNSLSCHIYSPRFGTNKVSR